MKTLRILIILAISGGLISCGTQSKKTKSVSGNKSGQVDFYDGDESKTAKSEGAEEADVEKSSGPEYPEAKNVNTKDFLKSLSFSDEDRVLEEASKVLSVNPNNDKVLNGLGVFYFKQKKPDLAKYFFGKTLKLNPSNSSALNNMGVISINENEERKAMEFFKKSIDAESDNVAALGNLGTIYLKYEDYEKAADVLKRAFSYDKSNITIANNYAVALVGINESSRALDIYEDLAKARNVSVQLNEALLLAEFKKDFTKAKEVLNKVRFLSTDPAILKKVNDLSKWMEGQKKQ